MKTYRDLAAVGRGIWTLRPPLFGPDLFAQRPCRGSLMLWASTHGLNTALPKPSRPATAQGSKCTLSSLRPNSTLFVMSEATSIATSSAFSSLGQPASDSLGISALSNNKLQEAPNQSTKNHFYNHSVKLGPPIWPSTHPLVGGAPGPRPYFAI